jgi:hypothetical protein
MAQQFIIYGSLDQRSLTNSTGATSTNLPNLYEGDQYTFQIRLLDKPDGVNTQLVYPTIRSFTCSIGQVNVPPLGGFIQLQFGITGAITEKIAFNEDALSFKEKLLAVPECAAYNLEEVYTPVVGCWMLRFGSAAIVPIQLAQNILEPETFCRINQFTRDGRRWIELKLIQAPVASTAVFDRVQGDIPTVVEVRKGFTEDDILFTVVTTEIQSLKVPTGWSGTFALSFQGLQTIFFSADSGIQDYQDGLNALYSDGIQRFKVTNPVLEEAYIEFVGPLAGQAFDPLGVIIGITKPGDVTFTIDLNTAEVNAAIRTAPKGFPAIMEVILEVANPTDPPETPGQRFVLFQAPVTILPELQWPGLVSTAPIDWLIPPQTEDFIPFTPDQIITGSQYYVQVFGTGSNSEYVFPHNLGTESIAAVTVRENHDMGLIINPDQYVITIIDAISLKITFPYDVGLQSLVAIITSAGPKSAFQAHTHTIAQIIGLQDILDELSKRVTVLESLLPTTIGGAAQLQVSGDNLLIEIPDAQELLLVPRTSKAASTIATTPSGTAVDPTTLPRANAMLPAILSEGTSGPLPSGNPTPANAGNVYDVTDPAGVDLPGGYGIVGVHVDQGGLVGSDGKVWYEAYQADALNTYYPSPFDRTLFTLFVNDRMFAVGSTFSLDFKLKLKTYKATSNIHWRLVIELGSAPSSPDPAPTEVNLENVVWIDNPGLSQHFIVTDVAVTHRFGFQVLRSLLSEITANQALYGVLSPALQIPLSANFALRARLIEFDTENSVPDARGLVYYGLTTATATIT